MSSTATKYDLVCTIKVCICAGVTHYYAQDAATGADIDDDYSLSHLRSRLYHAGWTIRV